MIYQMHQLHTQLAIKIRTLCLRSKIMNCVNVHKSIHKKNTHTHYCNITTYIFHFAHILNTRTSYLSNKHLTLFLRKIIKFHGVNNECYTNRKIKFWVPKYLNVWWTLYIGVSSHWKIQPSLMKITLNINLLPSFYC